MGNIGCTAYKIPLMVLTKEAEEGIAVPVAIGSQVAGTLRLTTDHTFNLHDYLKGFADGLGQIGGGIAVTVVQLHSAEDVWQYGQYFDDIKAVEDLFLLL